MGMMTVAQLQTHVYEDKMKNVENCESSSSGLKRRLKALNVKIRLFASSSSAVHDIKNVPERVFGMINEKMIF